MQVAAALTPSTAARVAAAIVAAYRDLRGQGPPAKSSWLWPLALSSNETAQWRKMWNWNVGNVTTLGDPATWYANPDVTAPLKFRAFDDSQAGARAMLQVLDRFGGLDAADRGDQTGWQRALDSYLGNPYPPPWGIIASLDSVQPDGGFEVVTPPTQQQQSTPTALVVATVAGLAAAAGYVARHRREALS